MPGVVSGMKRLEGGDAVPWMLKPSPWTPSFQQRSYPLSSGSIGAANSPVTLNTWPTNAAWSRRLAHCGSAADAF